MSSDGSRNCRYERVPTLIESIEAVSNAKPMMAPSVVSDTVLDSKSILNAIDEVCSKLMLGCSAELAWTPRPELARSLRIVSNEMNKTLNLILEKKDLELSHSILETIGQASNENLHSDFLAALLDPDVMGDFAYSFFDELFTFEKQAIGSLENKSWQRASREVRLDTINYSLKNTPKGEKRIDILAARGNRLLVIENKVGTQESDNQTTDYYETVRESQVEGQACVATYLLLSPNRQTPQSDAFSSIDYFDVWQILHGIHSKGPLSEKAEWLYQIYRAELMSTILKGRIRSYKLTLSDLEGNIV